MLASFGVAINFTWALVDLASPQVSCWHKIRVLDGTRAVVNYGWVGCRDGCIPDICTVSVDGEFDRLL